MFDNYRYLISHFLEGDIWFGHTGFNIQGVSKIIFIPYLYDMTDKLFYGITKNIMTSSPKVCVTIKEARVKKYYISKSSRCRLLPSNHEARFVLSEIYYKHTKNLNHEIKTNSYLFDNFDN